MHVGLERLEHRANAQMKGEEVRPIEAEGSAVDLNDRQTWDSKLERLKKLYGPENPYLRDQNYGW